MTCRWWLSTFDMTKGDLRLFRIAMAMGPIYLVCGAVLLLTTYEGNTTVVRRKK
jgi:hypothetical protein